jgi:hypothetical protein
MEMGELDLWTSEALPDARAVIGAGWFLVKTRISCIGYNETGVEGGSRKNNFGVWCLVFGLVGFGVGVYIHLRWRR